MCPFSKDYNGCQSPGYVSTIAGSGIDGFQDGQGRSAKFYIPGGQSLDSFGNLYVSDFYNAAIRKINSTGYVSTYLGNGVWGWKDGQGAAAQFSQPSGIVFDSTGIMLIVDNGNGIVRQVNSSGYISTYAGTPGVGGCDDGPINSALFYSPADITKDSSGNIYIRDLHSIRKISTSGIVSTVGGFSCGGIDGLRDPFNAPSGITVDSLDNLYVADTYDHVIRKINTTGHISIIAGSKGVSGWRDGQGTDAQFNTPNGITSDSFGKLFVVDTNNYVIRKVNVSGYVSTIAGVPGQAGGDDGQPLSAKFNGACCIKSDSAGNLIVSDTGNHKIRMIFMGALL